MELQIKNNGKISDSKIKIKKVSQRTIDETDIRQQIDNHVKALCNMDLKSVMSIYTNDIVSFDVDGTYLGMEAKRKVWASVFSIIESPINYEIRNLSITLADNIAFSYSYNRLSGKLKNGQKIGSWVRYTACFRKIDGKWLIAHEQVSLPVDFESGRALVDIEP